mmetsp:Transcript_37679/g.82712  ORF Transcript_37679/g.82712 Transcript_37679/m.82712 type:complete len:621 (-) Transcript_37679:36-1898(-)
MACPREDDGNERGAAAAGPWRRKPLWVVEMQARGEAFTISTSNGTSIGGIELAPLAPAASPSSRDDDAWADNESPSSFSPGSRGEAVAAASATNNHHHSTQRHLTLLDLLSIGIGGTVGSGIFVLCGLIATNFAGPATSLSFVISGLAAALSGCCYAELASKIPVPGSTYTYAYVAIGELAAVISASLLTLEYAVSGAAVARSWGDKVTEWLRHGFAGADDDGNSSGRPIWVDQYLDPEWLGPINPMAFVISATSTAILLAGVKESKRVVNFFTVVKVGLVLFMIVGGFVLTRSANWTPFVPARFGAAGIFRGATSSFFGFIGFDEVVCLAGESVNPSRDLAPAVLLTIAAVSLLYVFAALALTGMQPYDGISEASGFPMAFHANGVNWAAEIAAAGEVLCLPLVVIICLLAQPRLQQALAQDGLLPPIFGETDRTGNLWFGTLFAGVAMTLISLFVPFGYLDDFISAGILLAFCITNNAVVIMRCESRNTCHSRIDVVLGLYNIVAFVTAFLLNTSYMYRYVVMVSLFLLCLGLALKLACELPLTKVAKAKSEDAILHGFEVPFVPWLPCLAIGVNAVLIFQLETIGLLILFCYIAATAAVYFCYTRQVENASRQQWRQ